MSLQAWQRVWREGFVPHLNARGLAALRAALVEDAPALIQGATTRPAARGLLPGCEVEAACAISYCAWQSGGAPTVREVQRRFSALCGDCNDRLRDPAACSWFLQWFDETPREQMRAALLVEVEAALAARAEGACP